MKLDLLVATSALALASAAAPAWAQHQHEPGMEMPTPEQKPKSQAEPKAHEQHESAPTIEPDHAPAAHPANHSQLDRAAHGAMMGALGPSPMSRESSGTAWQPDTSEHSALHAMSGDWTLMAHGVLNLVYDHQRGRRGDDKAFASGMLMGMARRPIGDGTLQFKAMVSPDPLMGKRGYPLLLGSGETANGRDRLIDRQHPHDLFMELAL